MAAHYHFDNLNLNFKYCLKKILKFKLTLMAEMSW